MAFLLRLLTSMLTGLTSLLETSLVFTLASTDNEDTDIRLRGAANHAWHVRLVTGGIQNGVPPLLGLKESSADLDRLALGALLFSEIKSPRQIPGLTAGILSFSLILVHGSLVDHAGGV